MVEKNTHGVSMPLFMEDAYEALTAAVQALGGAKRVGALLWPAKPEDTARTNLLDCLNRDNARKLELEEIMTILRMAREAGFHRAKHWIDQATGYHESAPLDPEDERASLQRQFIESVHLQQKLAERLGVWDKMPPHLRVAK